MSRLSKLRMLDAFTAPFPGFRTITVFVAAAASANWAAGRACSPTGDVTVIRRSGTAVSPLALDLLGLWYGSILTGSRRSMSAVLGTSPANAWPRAPGVRRCHRVWRGVSGPGDHWWSSPCFSDASTTLAALCPLAPVTSPPGWVPAPHMYRPATGVWYPPP